MPQLVPLSRPALTAVNVSPPDTQTGVVVETVSPSPNQPPPPAPQQTALPPVMTPQVDALLALSVEKVSPPETATGAVFDTGCMKGVTANCIAHTNLLGDAPLPSPSPGADTMGMAAPIYWTADMVRALPDDGNRYEVVHGELLVTPAPRASHQLIVTRLVVALSNYLGRDSKGVVLVSPADISWGRKDVLVQPDVFVVAREEVRTTDWKQMRTLLLVGEVLSPTTARADRFVKRRRYQDAGVPLYWIVDGDERQVEIWTPAAEFPQIERERLTWHPDGAAHPLVLELEELFRPV